MDIVSTVCSNEVWTLTFLKKIGYNKEATRRFVKKYFLLDVCVSAEKFHLVVEVGGLLLHSYALHSRPKLIMMKHHRNGKFKQVNLLKTS